MPIFSIDVAVASERTDPGATAGTVKVYTKDAAGVTLAYAQLSDGTIQQLTPVTFSSGYVTYGHRDILLTFGPHTLADQAAAQNAFDLSTVTLTAGVAYHMQGMYILDSAASTNAVSVSMSFAGTATYTSFQYRAFGNPMTKVDTGSNSSAANIFNTYATSNAAIQVVDALATNRKWIRFEGGIIVVNVGGTFTPQISASGTPGQVWTMSAESYIELTPLGTSFTQQGGWG